MPVSYPTDASQLSLHESIAWMIGALLSGVAYGVELTLAVNCILLLRRKSLQNAEISKTTRNFHTAYILVACLLGTAAFVWTSISLIYSTLIPLDRLNSLSYYVSNSLGVPFSALELAFIVLVTWGSDGFMLWRCVILYSGITGLPRIVFNALITLTVMISLAFGACGLATNSPVVPWEQDQMLLRFESASLGINFFLSTLLVCRILYHKRYLERIFGKGYGSAYNKVVAICIESAMLTLFLNTVFIILANTVGSSIVNGPEILIVVKLIIHINIIYPLLIIFRVAQGKAFPSDPTSTLPTVNVGRPDALGTLRFVASTDSESTSTMPEICGTSIHLPPSQKSE